MIKLRNIEKGLKTKAGTTYLLRQINLDIGEGEFLTIMGPSGAGKSTLLSILGLYDSAWDGDYYFFTDAIHKMRPKERAEVNKRYVGFVFQQFHLLDNLTVAENLDIPLFLPKRQRLGAAGNCGGYLGPVRDRGQKGSVS